MAEGVWHQVVLTNGLGVAAKVERQDDGRWIVTEMYLHKDRITATDVRAVQPARFEADANATRSTLDRIALEHQRANDLPEPTLAELRQAFELYSKTAGELRADAPPRRARLTRPDRSDPEAFYKLVAEAYREYLQSTRAPAAAIAAEAGVPVTTVHRWVREARRRGALPRGEKGRAG